MITEVQNLIYFLEVDLIALLQELGVKTKKSNDHRICGACTTRPPDHSGKSLSATLESLFTEVKLHFIPTCSRSFSLFSSHFAGVNKSAGKTGVVVQWQLILAHVGCAVMYDSTSRKLSPNFVAVSATISLSLQSNVSHFEVKLTNRFQLSL